MMKVLVNKRIDGACYSTSCQVDCRALSLLAARSSRISLPFCYSERWWGPAASVVDVWLVFSIQIRDVAFSNVNFIRSHGRCV